MRPQLHIAKLKSRVRCKKHACRSDVERLVDASQLEGKCFAMCTMRMVVVALDLAPEITGCVSNLEDLCPRENFDQVREVNYPDTSASASF